MHTTISCQIAMDYKCIETNWREPTRENGEYVVPIEKMQWGRVSFIFVEAGFTSIGWARYPHEQNASADNTQLLRHANSRLHVSGKLSEYQELLYLLLFR